MVLWIASWPAVALAGLITIPVKYPFDRASDFIDSGAIVGVLLPIIVGSFLLREGTQTLVIVAGRRLGPYRALCSVGYIAITMTAAAGTAPIIPGDSNQLLLVAFLLCGCVLVSVAVLGARAPWPLAVLVVAASSAPGLIPLDSNYLYRVDAKSDLLFIGCGMVFVGLIGYMIAGSVGLLHRLTTSPPYEDLLE